MSCVIPVEFKILQGRFSGSAQAIFPQIQLVDTVVFDRPYALVGLQLSSSLTIYGTNFGGFAVVVGNKQQTLSISQALVCPFTQISQPNSFAGPPPLFNPTSKSASVSFGQFAYPLPAQTPVSLYAFADATADNDLFAVCSLYVVRLK